MASAPAADTTVTITVYDSLGASDTASLVLDLTPALPLNVTPASITLTGFTNPDGTNDDNVIFFITGGIPDYRMFSSNNALIASIGPLGAGVIQFTIDPEAVGANQTVTLTIEDSVGVTKTVTVNLTPTSSSMAVNPATIAVLRGSTVPVYILGGSFPYTLHTTSATCAPVPASPYLGTSFNVSTGGGLGVCRNPHGNS